MSDEIKPATWAELKEFILGLPEEQLQASVSFQDDESGHYLQFSTTSEDLYIYDGDPESCCPMDIMKDCVVDFEEDLCELVVKKGTPFFYPHQ